jgi:hypothetical protein
LVGFLLGLGFGNLLAGLPDERFVFLKKGGCGFAVAGLYGGEILGDGVEGFRCGIGNDGNDAGGG